jgi:DNA replication and repair protein RecF
VFHVEPAFVGIWRRYQRALKQRNAALRADAPDEVVKAWDPELIESGNALAQSRRRYFTHLQPAVAHMGEQLLGRPVELRIADGWAHDSGLGEAVERSWVRDRQRGMTHAGPHRADLAIRVADHPAKHRVSRGQQKLTAAAMLLGQLKCDAALGSPTSALLVDDPAAELDDTNLERVISLVVDLPAQLFVTALNPTIRAFERLPPTRRFHVEHGKITRLL